ncbi:Invasin [Yersinia aldovae]|uniref:Ig-like domain-containing protein n=1 Tax=Yersinia aldovae TaxID=29483 RepID=UPI0005E90CAC|nr:Ig-like domain-containing protein [Yersinia aldovae]CNK05628.1 Invasin [Yersinia aldovae]
MRHRSSVFTAFLWRRLLALMVIISPVVLAVQQTTPPVHGRAPTSVLSVNTTTPRVGDIITVTAAFNDADGDAEYGTTYQWLLDGALISGETSPSYKLRLSDILAGSELNIVVTPQTNPGMTEPSTGLPVQLPSPINIKWQRVISRLVWGESPLGVVADGQAMNTVHATVQYLDGTPAVGAAVLFDVDDRGVVSTVQQSDINGVATATVTNTLAGITQVTAHIDDDAQAINVAFIAGPVALVHAEVTQNNAIANGNDDNKVQVNVKDRYNNNIVGETVSFTATNGVTLLSQQGHTDDKGDVTLALNSQAAVTSDVTATTINGMSDTVTVQFFNEVHLTHILVNGASFSANEGFPETGFIGAQFQLVIGEDPTENNAYSWYADQNWVSVDGSGNVRFNQEPTSANNRVIITAEHKTNHTSLTYVFTPTTWFRNNSSAIMAPINADAWCGSQGSGYAIPGYGQMTDRVPDFPTGSHRDANGKLWNEWGSMNKYATGWYSGNYWVKELTTEGNARHYVYLGNGNLFSFPLDGSTYVTCSVSL